MFNENLYDLPSYDTLFGRWHNDAQVEYLLKWALCPKCGTKPTSIEPLDDGWYWDCMGFTCQVWCPDCLREADELSRVDDDME